MSTIDVRYTCGTCPVANAKVTVREREPKEDVVEWVERVVGKAVSVDHWRRSPYCTATSVRELKIPVPPGENPYIGEATKH